MHLFAPEPRRKPVYRSLAAELDAIKRGAKPISFFASERGAIEDGSDLIPIMKAAFTRGLAVTTAPRGKNTIDVFVHRTENAARVAPLQTLLARTPWTFALEEKLGVLLGYTAAQRAAWMAAERYARPELGVVVLYRRGPVDGSAISVWFAQPGRVVSPRAFAKVARTTAVFRVGIDPAFKLRRNGIPKLGTAAEKAAFEAARRTPIQRLTAKGWR